LIEGFQHFFYTIKICANKKIDIFNFIRKSHKNEKIYFWLDSYHLKLKLLDIKVLHDLFE